MRVIKMTAVEKISDNWNYGSDYNKGFKWEIETDYPYGTTGMHNDIIWAVNEYGFDLIGEMGMGMFYIIDLEHENIRQVLKDDNQDFSGFVRLYKELIRERNLGLLIDEVS